MKQYAIVERYTVERKPYWVAYRYSWKFRLFGAGRYSYIIDSMSFVSPDVCKEKLSAVLDGIGNKYEVLEIIKL